MEIRNWNEIIGKNGIRIEIEIFFRMEITLFFYDARCYFNVCSIADLSQRNLLHGTKK